MYNTFITELSIAQPSTYPFRWGWDSNHYVPLTYPCHLQLLKLIRLMSNLKLTKRTTSSNAFNTFANRFMTYLTKPMLSTSNDMINIGCHTTSRWVKRCGYICRRSASLDPPQASPAPIWVIHNHQGCREQCLQAQYSTIPWSAPSIQCGLPSALFPTSTGYL